MTKTVSDREKKLDLINAKIEVNLELIGSTAIEDKL
jgi:magnesium-transporting ATPase (P-type)